MPIVFLDRYLPDQKISYVISDHFTGTKAAIEHLISLGHRKIAFMGRKGATSIRDKYLGYVDALKIRNIPLNEKLIYYEEYVVIDPGETPLKYKQFLSEDEYQEALVKHGGAFKAKIGADAVKEILKELDLKALFHLTVAVLQVNKAQWSGRGFCRQRGGEASKDICNPPSPCA